jgi:hypothetical protein
MSVRRSALPSLFPQWLSLMEPGEEQFVAECENDRADEQVMTPDARNPPMSPLDPYSRWPYQLNTN